MFAPNRDPFAEPLVPAPGETAPAEESSRTAGQAEALGERYLMYDPAAAATFEVLEIRPEFATPEFETALRARVDKFFTFSHPSLETGYTVERRKGALQLVTKQATGRRLSDLLPKAQGAGFALELIRLVTPVLAAISRTGDDAAHGLLTADRILVTRDGRLVVLEPVFGPAVATLSRSRSQLIEMGLVIPGVKAGEPIVFDGRADLTQLGFLALSLLLGRKLDPWDYPDKMAGLLDEFVIHANEPMLAAKLRTWLERAMQLSQRAFATTADAEAALIDLPQGLTVQPAAQTAAGSPPAPAPASPTVVSFRKEREKDAAPLPPPATVKDEDLPSEDKKAPAPKTAKPVMSISIGDHAPAATPHQQQPQQQAAPPRKKGGWSRWVIAALVLIAIGQGAALYVQPYLRPAADVIEIRPQAAALTRPPATVPPAAALTGADSAAPVTDQAAATIAGVGAPAPGLTPQTNTAAPPSGPPAAPATQQASVPAAGATTPPAASAPRFGGLTVTSRIDLQVIEDGKVVGSTAGPLALTEGSHTLDLVNETLGFRHSQAVTIRGGRMLTLNIDVPKGRLSINAIPWADVEIDGTPAGQTPLANVSLPIGSHQITFRHPEFGTRTQTVIVKVDGSAKVTQTFRPGGN